MTEEQQKIIVSAKINNNNQTNLSKPKNFLHNSFGDSHNSWSSAAKTSFDTSIKVFLSY